MRTRCFNHADLTQIVQIWNAHHQLTQPTTTLITIAFESAVFGKPWFDRRDFHVFVDDDDSAVGLCHLIPSSDQVHLAALCFQSPEEGTQSLDVLDQLLAQVGDQQIRAGLTLDDNLGYLGLNAIAGAAGISVRDPAARQWLPSLGFAPTDRYHIHELPLTGFRPPLDRETLRLRRVSRTRVDESPRLGCAQQRWAFGHLHEIAITVSQPTGDTIGRAEFAFPNSEICGALPQTAILISLESTDERGSARWTMIAAAEALGQLGVPGMRVIERDDSEPADWIRRLGFQEVDVGVVLERGG